MHRTYVFNGDADGLCALQQLRLAEPSERPDAVTLVTGVKRDIALLDRVKGEPGDSCTVLDISLDVNRAALCSLLDAGVSVRYFDHHFAGEIPESPHLEAHIDLGTSVCTSLLVDRYLEGRFRSWAVVGAFGDSLVEEGRALAQAARAGAGGGGAPGGARGRHQLQRVRRDHRGSPCRRRPSWPRRCRRSSIRWPSPTARRPTGGWPTDIAMTWSGRARSSRIARRQGCPHVRAARRGLGPARERNAGQRSGQDLRPERHRHRVTQDHRRLPGLAARAAGRVAGADSFCRQFPTGGGRRAAAGINHLPADQLEAFAASFEEQFRAV